MYIQNKLISAFYKLSLGLISLYGFWMTLSLFGATAWRLFSTWALLIGAIYFCLSALVLALSNKREAGTIPCAMLEGMLIVAFIIQGIASASSTLKDVQMPGLEGFAAALTYYVLPVLTMLDWCLFNKKGQWRAIDPFYWLALPLAYSAMIILTANMLPSSTALLYPVAFLDYNTHGLWEMLGWLALLGLLILIFGYILILLDAFMGGIIAKHIVLPHIRTVTVDDEDSACDDLPDDEKASHIEMVDAEVEEVEPASKSTIRQATEVEDDDSEIIEPDEIISAKAGATTNSNATTSPNATAKTNETKAHATKSRSAKTNSSKSASSKASAVKPDVTKPKTSRPKNKPNNATKSRSSKPDAGAKSAQTANSQSSHGRKINDITKPQADKSASSIHKSPKITKF